MKKSLVLFVVIVLAFVTACSGGGNSVNQGSNNEQPTVDEVNQAEGNQEANQDATVMIGIPDPVLTLDPANYRDRTTESVVRNIFDGLVSKQPDGTVAPLIASSWDNPSPLEWVFTIRDDVKFHDGTPMTVDDVLFTFERLITEGAVSGNTSPRKGLMGPLTAVEKMNDNTIKFVLDEPWPILIQMLPHQQIVPKAYIEKVGDEEFAKNPIGAGPYKFKQANLSELIELERFDDYYGSPVQIKNLVFRVIPETSSRIASLLSGEVHRIQGVKPEHIPSLEAAENIEVKTADGTRVYMIEMNVNQAPFDNKLVRQAMNHAINMDSIVDNMLVGYGQRLRGPLLEEAFGLNTNLSPYAYDPEKATALLKEAGYEAGDISLIIDVKDTESEIAEAVASQLRQIGIDAQTRVWDWGVLLPLIKNGERMMYMTDWGNSTQDPYDFLNPKLRSDDRGNFSFYSNDRVDELLNQASTEIDREKRENMYFEAQELIYDEAPWVFGYSKLEVEAGLKSLKNWEPAIDSMLSMHESYLEE